MADGMLCKWCGWQETSHEIGASEEEANSLKDTKKKTLAQCMVSRGFTPENPRLAKKLAKAAQEEADERAMRGLDPFGE